MSIHSVDLRKAAPAACAFLLLLGVQYVLVGPVHANPIPDVLIYTHVQPANSNFCNECTIDSCDAIAQNSDLTGYLDFDFFYDRGFAGMGDPVLVEMTVSWPQEWVHGDAEICSGESGVVDIQGNVAQFTIYPDETSGSFFLLARIVLNVTGYGVVEVYDCHVQTDSLVAGLHAIPTWYVGGVGARAGLECGDCSYYCGRSGGPYPCYPEFTPETLELEVVQGEVAHGEIVANSLALEECPTVFEASEDWMELEIETIGYEEHLITVTIDTSTMLPGIHEGWVTGDVGDCQECAKVRLIVHDYIAVSRKSWGAVKGIYR